MENDLPQTDEMESRLRQVSRQLCTALDDALGEALATAVDTHSIRPIQLTEQLGLNKTLASRVARSIREPDELRALHGLPTPQGLQLIETAAKKRGASAPAIRQLREAASAYSDVLSEFSGGRTDLEATLAAYLPEERARAERDARRSVFRGMTTIEGVRTSTAYHAVFLSPSAVDDDQLDIIVTVVRRDVRRLRPRQEIPLMRIAGSTNRKDWKGPSHRLDGTPVAVESIAAEGLEPFRLDALCSRPVPPVEVEEHNGALYVRIGQRSLAVNEVATLAYGWRMPACFRRHAKTETDHLHLSFSCPKPTEELVVDLFVHETLSTSELPLASLSRELTINHSKVGGPPPANSVKRQGAPELVKLAPGRGGLSSWDVRGHSDLAALVADEASFDLSSYSAFRATLAFPMPTEELTIWQPRKIGSSDVAADS